MSFCTFLCISEENPGFKKKQTKKTTPPPHPRPCWRTFYLVKYEWRKGVFNRPNLIVTHFLWRCRAHMPFFWKETTWKPHTISHTSYPVTPEVFIIFKDFLFLFVFVAMYRSGRCSVNIWPCKAFTRCLLLSSSETAEKEMYVCNDVWEERGGFLNVTCN